MKNDAYLRVRIGRRDVSYWHKAESAGPQMHVRNLNAIRWALEEHGIEFLDLNGVRLLSRVSHK
jgi:hypothetical protein